MIPMAAATPAGCQFREVRWYSFSLNGGTPIRRARSAPLPRASRRLPGEPDEEPSGEELVKQLSMSEEDYVSYVNADFRPGFFGAKIPEL